MKCKCKICKIEGKFVESTDVVCLPCYDDLEAEVKRLKVDSIDTNEVLFKNTNAYQNLEAEVKALRIENNDLRRSLEDVEVENETV